MRVSILFILLLTVFSYGCQKFQRYKGPDYPPTDTIRTTYRVIADSISYGVVVRNRDTNNIWQEKWLSHLQRDSLVDRVFEAVYNKELKPYDYFTEKPVPVKEIRELEESKKFKRSLIGKIQFEEVWYFDPGNLRMVKSVNSIMLAYEIYRRDSTFRGYKPAFKVYLNKPFQR